MQPSYRAAPEPPRPVVIFYRAVPAWLAALLTVVLLGFFVGAGFATAQLTRSVTLDMSRPDDACTVTRSYPGFGADVETHVLSSIRGTRLVASRGRRGGPSYGVELTTAGQPIGISELHTSYARRLAQKEQIDAFLGSKDPSLHLVYDAGGGVGWLMLLVALLPVVFIFFVWQGARVTVDAASRILTIERTRWPFRAASQSIPVGEIESVDVRTGRGRKGGVVYRTVLIMRSGQEVPLLRTSSNMLGPHQRAADQIRAALQQASVPVGGEV